MSFKKCSFILLAGGKGARMESPFKQFRLLGGMPLWAWGFKLSCELCEMGLIGEVIVVFPKDFDFSNEVKIINELNIPFKVNVVEGGETRAISSLAGISAASGDYVLVHDAARPFASSSLVQRIISSITP